MRKGVKKADYKLKIIFKKKGKKGGRRRVSKSKNIYLFAGTFFKDLVFQVHLLQLQLGLGLEGVSNRFRYKSSNQVSLVSVG